MQLTVLVERIDEQRYRAETAQPVSLVTEGRTREEAVARLRDLAQQRLTAGEILQLELPEASTPQPHPWLPYAGIWKDHPAIDALVDNIARARRQSATLRHNHDNYLSDEIDTPSIPANWKEYCV